MMQGAMELYLTYNPVSNDIRVYEPAPNDDSVKLLAIMQPEDKHYGPAFQALTALGNKSQFAEQARLDNEERVNASQ